MTRPAIVKRMCDDVSGPLTVNFHACWQHAYRLEDDTFDVPGFKPAEHEPIKPVDAAERDDAGSWCGFCE